VQGDGAAEGIARTIRLASRRQDCDLLLLVRGGGSLEDLRAFNEETVARAIFDCAIPLVTGIGHETDVTIADFAADLRAATPTAAAELASPDRLEWLRQVRLLAERLDGALQRRFTHQRQRLAELTRRLDRAQPRHRLRDRAQRLDDLDQRLRAALRQRLTTAAQRLRGLSGHLHALSPLATLDRGYAILRRQPGGEILRRADAVRVGDAVEALLGQGRLYCQVTAIDRADPPLTVDRDRDA
jgi:exodeoxyribonuclease VII large subunit